MDLFKDPIMSSVTVSCLSNDPARIQKIFRPAHVIILSHLLRIKDPRSIHWLWGHAITKCSCLKIRFIGSPNWDSSIWGWCPRRKWCAPSLGKWEAWGSTPSSHTKKLTMGAPRKRTTSPANLSSFQMGSPEKFTRLGASQHRMGPRIRIWFTEWYGDEWWSSGVTVIL